MTIDLHGYYPADIVDSGVLRTIAEKCWEMGVDRLCLIHGHGRNRGILPGFVNTNTGYFGLEIRRALRHDSRFREWIHHTTLNCGDPGLTSVKVKKNPSPSRKSFPDGVLP